MRIFVLVTTLCLALACLYLVLIGAEGWFLDVATPAFVPNHTVLYDHSHREETL